MAWMSSPPGARISQADARRLEPSTHDPKMHRYTTISEAEKTDALAQVVRLFPAPPESRASPTRTV